MKLSLIFLSLLYFLNNFQSSEAAEKCGFGRKRCNNGQCIHPYSWCDGIIDCADGSDEIIDICEKQRYPNYGYHDCISNRIECDNNNNCIINCIRFEPEIIKPEPKCFVPIDNFLTLVDVADNTTLYPNTNAESLISIDYVCTKGSILIGETTTNFCIGDQWVNEHPKCIKNCQPLVDHTIQSVCTYEGYEVSCNDEAQPETKAEIRCEIGYKEVKEQNGKEEIFCQSDGNWDDLPLKCEQICGTIDKEDNFSDMISITEISQVPWTVGIYKKILNDNYEYVCAGTLLRSKIVLTATHCFFDNPYSRTTNLTDFVVTAGKYYRDFYAANELNDNIQIRNIVHMEKSPLYNMAFFASNLAVLVLDDHIKFNNFVKPACFKSRHKREEYVIQSGKMGVIAGWGITNNGYFTSQLQSVELNTVDSETCINEKKIIHPQYAKDKFCLETIQGNNVCEGDSGGGFLIPETVDNQIYYHLWGVINNGAEWKKESAGNCSSQFITTLTNVQINSFMIDNAVKKAY